MGDIHRSDIERNLGADCCSQADDRARGLLVCSGPPADRQQDKKMAELVRVYSGVKLVCGGTTAQILAREWGSELRVCLDRGRTLLPPTSVMPGVDLVTEGVLTLTRVKHLLQNCSQAQMKGVGPDDVIARMLLRATVIDFLVGTCEKPTHVRLPVELERRVNLIQELVHLLETKFKKRVTVQYI